VALSGLWTSLAERTGDAGMCRRIRPDILPVFGADVGYTKGLGFDSGADAGGHLCDSQLHLQEHALSSVFEEVEDVDEESVGGPDGGDGKAAGFSSRANFGV
jgi:hypothetical protein